MSRPVRIGVAIVLGLMAGAGTMFVVQGGSDLRETTGAAPAAPSTEPPPTTSAPPSTTEAPAPELLLAWTAGGLPSGFAAAVDALPSTARVTTVLGDPIDLAGATDPDGRPVGPTAPPGMQFPVDAIAIDPATYPAFVPRTDRPVFRDLAPGEAILGETSARLRGVDAGGRIRVSGGPELVVAAVVPDPLVAAAELVVSTASAAAVGVDTERYVLVTATESADAVGTDINGLVGPDTLLRLRRPGETPYLRSSDAVLPQARIKDVFGEFAYVPPGPGVREFQPDPAWVEANIVDADLPVIGHIRCHRSLVPAIRGAMQELVDRNLAGLVQGTQGCFNPRLIRAGGDMSRHAWGAAIDLNVGSNPTGVASIQDERLVAVMERWGFVSGADWLVPDPGHFEYVGPAPPT